MWSEARQTLITPRDLLRFAVSRFNEAGLSFGHGCTNAVDEAAYLILHSLHLPLEQMDPFFDARLVATEIEQVLVLLERRVRERIPAAYLTREAWLGAHRFHVDERCIVPRSHLAHLLGDEPAAYLPIHPERALDLCTGSGCLAVLLALTYPDARVDAVDLSVAALEVATLNRDSYQMQGRVRLLHSDLFAAVAEQRYDLILCNPPYVDDNAMSALPAEYLWEPRTALAGGGDGLDLVRRILLAAPEHLTPDGVLVMEIGDRRQALERSFPKMPFLWPEDDDATDQIFAIDRRTLTAALA